MELVVDGHIFSGQKKGGISRIFLEILPRMCDLANDLEVHFWAFNDFVQAPPIHSRIIHQTAKSERIKKWLRPGRVWHRWAVPLNQSVGVQSKVRHRSQAVWQSTYFTDIPLWRGKKVVFVYDMIYELFPELFNSEGDRYFRALKRRAVLDADAIICISSTTAMDIADIYRVNSSRINVAHLAPSNVFAAPGAEEVWSGYTEPYILYVGKRYHYKGFNSLIKAYSHSSLSHNVVLICIGPSFSQEELSLIKAAGMADRVVSVGEIDDAALRSWYSNAVAFIYPSLYEGFGIPLVEAMACGTPIVASDIPSTREVAGQIPYYFDPGDDESLAAVLKGVVLQSADADRMQAARMRAATFSWDVTARTMLDIYRAL